MSIRPPSDIVLDVARAADPQAYKAAAARLDAANVAAAFAPSEAAAAEFASVFDQLGVGPAASQPGSVDETIAPSVADPAGPTPIFQMPFDAAAAMTSLKNATTLASSTSVAAPASANVYQNFEAMVLSSFVETMMPQDSEATFGAGTAGQVWRSMMAQQIATQLASAGGIGIAQQLETAAGLKAAAAATTS